MYSLLKAQPVFAPRRDFLLSPEATHIILNSFNISSCLFKMVYIENSSIQIELRNILAEGASKFFYL